MNLTPTTWRERPRALGLALAALALFWWPGQALGSCGDYLHAGGAGAAKGNSSPAVPPCKGPSCSRGEAPLLPPAPAQRLAAPLDARASEAAGRPDEPLVRRACDDPDRALPPPPVFSIFHPPR